MKRFCIFTNTGKDPGLKFTGQVREALMSLGASVTFDTDGDYECIVALGGDGTIIEAVGAANRDEVTVVGINLGHLGFLSSVERDEVDSALKALVNDDFDIESRMMIEASVDRGKGPEPRVFALNDIVINRSGYSGMIRTNVNVNSSPANSYFSDGIIIATPTGSTGYNLSAGGPIVTPEAQLMVFTPICPHSLNMRSVVVSSSDVITVGIDLSHGTDPENAILTIDGRRRDELAHGDTVTVRCSKRKIGLIRFRNRDFFRLLYMKLGDIG